MPEPTKKKKWTKADVLKRVTLLELELKELSTLLRQIKTEHAALLDCVRKWDAIPPEPDQ